MQIEFVPKKPLHEVCEDAARDVERYITHWHRDKETLWSQLAGKRLSEMQNNPKVTIGYLSHPEAGLRFVAASLVAEYWPPNESFAEPCYRIAFSDSEPLIRGAALASILYKLHPFLQDSTGILGQLLASLRALEPPIPDQVVQEARLALKHGLRRADELEMQYCREFCGTHLEAMIGSLPAAEAFLEHPNADLRCGALLVIARHWKSVADLRRICIHLIREDSDTNVRMHAIDAMAAVINHDDPEVGELAARIVQDPCEAVSLRKRAYVALLTLRNMPLDRWLQCYSDGFCIPDDIDWDFVNSFVSVH